MIGVNTNNSDPKQLSVVMRKEQMNWRSFATTDAIKTEWNDPGTPLYYVIDRQGVIRHKWYGNPGAKSLDAALNKLFDSTQ